MRTFHSNKNWAEQTRQAMSKFAAGRGSLAEAYEIWTRIRRNYCSTAVTYSSDRLVALSSIAAAFEPLLADKYHAGIWHRTAVYDLLWNIGQPRKRSNHGAPSWSLASMDGTGISWPSQILPRFPHDIQQLARVVTAETTPYSSHNPTGRVLSGRIELQCFGPLFDTESGEFSDKFLRKIHKDKPGCSPPKLPPVSVRFDEDGGQTTDQQLVCLLLVLRYMGIGEFMLQGLIVADQSDGIYRRTGYFICGWEADNTPDLHWYLDRVVLASDRNGGNFYDLVVLI
ncbi:hypothetical protein CEP53_012716 [Fusarium sp. AF-6]|nr:hypothetical protein CEP53_012716 [Fusarium sp. AF-6]